MPALMSLITNLQAQLAATATPSNIAAPPAPITAPQVPITVPRTDPEDQDMAGLDLIDYDEEFAEDDPERLEM